MFIIVLQREFDFSCDHHRATAPSLTGTAINRRHRIRTCLKKDYSLSNLLDIQVSIKWTNKTGGRDSYKYNHITHEGTIFSNIYSKTGQGCPRGKMSRMQPRIHVVHVDHRVTRSCSRSRADDRGAARFWQAASIICKSDISINQLFFTIQRNLK